MAIVAQLVANGLVAGAACGALAVAFAVLYRVGGFYQFTLASIYAAAAYASMPRSASATAVALAFGAGITTAVAVAVLLEFLIYARLRKRLAPPLIPMLASIGMAVVAENLLAIMFGPGLRPSPAIGARVLSIGSIDITQLRLVEAIACTAAGLGCVLFLHRTELGTILRAVAADYDLAALKGINVRSTVLLGTGMGGIVSAVPAFFAALDTGSRPQMGNLPLLLAIAAVLVVGSRDPVWWFVAGLTLGLIQQFAILTLTARWADTAVFAIFCGALVARQAFLFRTRSD